MLTNNGNTIEKLVTSGTTYFPALRSKLDEPIKTAYVPAPFKSRLDDPKGTAYMPAPFKSRLVEPKGTAYAPAPFKSRLDINQVIIEFISAYVPAPRSRIIFYDIISFGTCYYPGPKSRLDEPKGTAYAPAPYRSLLDEPIKTAYIPAPYKSRLDDPKGTAYMPAPFKSRLVESKGTAYAPAPFKSRLDINQVIIEFRSTYVPAPISRIIFYDIISFGTCYYPGPKSRLDEPVVWSVFAATDKLIAGEEGEEDEYKIPNHKDILTELIDDSEYDMALERVRGPINEILNKNYKGNFKIEQSASIVSSITTEFHEHRRYELEVYDTEIKDFQYILIYTNGIVNYIGNIPVEEILNVLRQEGKWEAKL